MFVGRQLVPSRGTTPSGEYRALADELAYARVAVLLLGLGLARARAPLMHQEFELLPVCGNVNADSWLAWVPSEPFLKDLGQGPASRGQGREFLSGHSAQCPPLRLGPGVGVGCPPNSCNRTPTNHPSRIAIYHTHDVVIKYRAVTPFVYSTRPFGDIYLSVMCWAGPKGRPYFLTSILVL